MLSFSRVSNLPDDLPDWIRAEASVKRHAAAVREAAVLGADGYYGHVAVVEQVNSDGSILISQSGTGWMAVVTQTISAAQLKANAGGVSFIH